MNMHRLRRRAESMVKTPLSLETGHLQSHDIQALIHDLQVHQIELEMQNDELRQAHDQLMTSRDRYSLLFDSAPVAYCTLDIAGIILDCNHTMSVLFARGRESLLHFPLGNLVVETDLIALTHLIKHHHHEGEHRLRMKKGNNDVIHALIHMRPMKVIQVGDPAWLMAITDITEIHTMNLEIQIQGKALDAALEGVMITNSESVICYVNRAFSELTGYHRDEVIGQSPKLLRSDRHNDEFYNAMWREIKNTGKWQGEIWNRRASGEIFPEWLNISTIYDEWQRPLYYVGVFSDISRDEMTRKNLHQLAYYDALTHLPNRHLFFDRLRQQIMHARRTALPFALLVMDLDRFKIINDTMGHTTGDLLLLKVSERLTHLLRENDTIARMGGDEFMLILPMLKPGDDAHRVAKKILSIMAEPFDLGGRNYHISISIGISFYPDDGLEEESLIKHADTAMYKAKDAGRNTYQTYHHQLNDKLAGRVSLENDLREALNSNALSLAYQPQYDLRDGKLTGVEALLRWHHPVHGHIPPGNFISLAEESNLIVDLGNWVMRTAAQQYMSWRSNHLDVGCMSINLSPHQFLQNDLLEQISQVLQETGMPACALGVEITESAAMPNFHYSVNTLSSLRAMGVGIFIDDFGTGFSSLSHLRNLPINAVKIDQQFIKKLPTNENDAAITHAIIAMSNSLNLQIIAEGVENSEQIHFLRLHGCHVAQGFALARPMSAEELVKHGTSAFNFNR